MEATLPWVGLGTWRCRPEAAKRAVGHALRVGYRHVDSASAYFHQEAVGQALAEALHLDETLVRSDLFITSKLWSTHHHPEDVEAACRKTLSQLGLDQLDLYLMHGPMALRRGDDFFPKDAEGNWVFENDLHPTDTWLAMESLVRKGLCRRIGVSNFHVAQLQDLLDKGQIVPANHQIECHPYLAQTAMIEFCQENKISVTAYSPLGSPQRPWAKSQPHAQGTLLEDETIHDIARKHGRTAAQVLLRWQIQRGVAVIPKSETPKRIEENFRLFDFELAPEDMERIGKLDRNERLFLRPKFDKNGELHRHFPFRDEL